MMMAQLIALHYYYLSLLEIRLLLLYLVPELLKMMRIALLTSVRD